jgi:signal transduction histidine kinase
MCADSAIRFVSEITCLHHHRVRRVVSFNFWADNEPFHRRGSAPLEDNRMHRFWHPAAQCLLGGIGLVSLTFVCYRLHSNLATTGFLLVIVVSLPSLIGNFVSSIIISLIAVLCLAYIAPPNNSFRVDDPLDVVAIGAFLTTSLIIALLVSKLRKMAEVALLTVSYRVVEAEEQERQRFAEDLHEDIGQRLSLLAIEIDQLKTDFLNQTIEARSRMDAAYKQILERLADVKALAHELHSARLEYLDLAAVMRSFCAEFGERKGVEIDFTSHGLSSFTPPDISLCLFRVLQEALQNALRHSGVRQFDVQLQGTSGEIQLLVRESAWALLSNRQRRALGLVSTTCRSG